MNIFETFCIIIQSIEDDSAFVNNSIGKPIVSAVGKQEVWAALNVFIFFSALHNLQNKSCKNTVLCKEFEAEPYKIWKLQPRYNFLAAHITQ